MKERYSISFLQPSKKIFRFTILAVVSLISFCILFSFDIFGAIAPTLVAQLGVSRGTIGTFYTAYAVAAILSVLLAGLASDRLGYVKAGLIFLSLAILGAGLISVFATIDLLLLGRFVFGLGAESILVVNMAIISKWFKGKEMAMAMGIYVSFGRIGTIFSFNTGELIADHFGDYRYVFIIAFSLSLLALLFLLLYIFLEKQAEKTLGPYERSPDNKITIKKITKFPYSFWLIALLCMLFYSAVFPFTALSTDFFVDKWNIARVAQATGSFFHKVFNNFGHIFSTAGGITSIITCSSLIFAPLAGFFVDKSGKRATFMIVGPVLMITSFLLLGFTAVYPVLPMILLGSAFVILPAALWPSIPRVIDEKYTGSAYGLTFAIQNIGVGLFPLLNGWLRDRTQTYQASMIMFAFLGLASLMLALMLKQFDRKHGQILERP
ncbi:MAG: MFS transporter [Candidatus Aminicenantes bacterium]|nr:MFS transporter [Candidatus Aminicenantes bacterium]